MTAALPMPDSERPFSGPIVEISEAVAAHFPAHGSCKIGGHLGLLFPVLSALRLASDRRVILGAPKRKQDFKFPQAYIPFKESLANLVVSLGMVRELALSFPHRYLTERSVDKDVYASRAFERSPVLISSVLTHLKRSADRFAQGACAILFKRTGHDMKRFRDLQKTVLDPKAFARLEPLVDPVAAADLFRSRADWYYAVAGRGDTRGLRTLAEHDLTTIESMFVVSFDSSTEIKDAEIVASLVAKQKRAADVMAEVKQACAAMCLFLEAFCKLVGHEGGYNYEDAIGFVGSPGDGIHYWPAIA